MSLRKGVVRSVYKECLTKSRRALGGSWLHIMRFVRSRSIALLASQLIWLPESSIASTDARSGGKARRIFKKIVFLGPFCYYDATMGETHGKGLLMHDRLIKQLVLCCVSVQQHTGSIQQLFVGSRVSNLKPLSDRHRMRPRLTLNIHLSLDCHNHHLKFLGNLANVTPIMLSRVTSSLSRSRLQPSVPSGRLGSTIYLCTEQEQHLLVQAGHIGTQCCHHFSC